MKSAFSSVINLLVLLFGVKLLFQECMPEMLFLFKVLFKVLPAPQLPTLHSLSKKGSMWWWGHDSWLTPVIRMLSLFLLSLLQTCGSSLSHHFEGRHIVLFWPFDHYSLKIHCYASPRNIYFSSTLFQPCKTLKCILNSSYPFRKHYYTMVLQHLLPKNARALHK